MIVTPDIYFHNPRMNIGVHYDQRQPAFPSLTHHPWMSTSTTLQVKEEPRDDTEYGQGRSLTPPYISNYPGATAYQEDTPPKDPPPASSSPRENLESSNSEGEYCEFGDSQMQLEVTSRSGMIAEEKLKCPVCKFTCSVRPQFNEHLRIHKFRCSECVYNAESATDLKEHLKTLHGVDDSENSIEKDPNKLNMNAQGKVKTFTCRHCPFTVITKIQLWNHLRTHIKPERILMCPCCEFVTEYKHHLEYHLRNHWKHKPYSCDKCPYRCVNKSMLSSHMKSHSNVYQYRCINCNYATKYCHSLKTHLKKYDHEPGMVLNPDGSPNPLPIIDVYGRRRGPKQKPKNEQKPKQESKPVQEQQPQIEFQNPPQIPGIFHPYSTLMQTQMLYYNNLNRYGGFPFSQSVRVEETNNNVEKIPLDLSRSEPMKEDSNQEPPVKNRRKGKAFKLNRIALRLQQQVEKEEYQPEQQQEVENKEQQQPVEKEECQPEQQQQVEMGEYRQKQVEKKEFQTEKQQSLLEQQQPAQTAMDVEPPHSPEIKSCEADSEQKADMTDVKINYTCVYCGLGFSTYAFYTVHMGYHGYDDPFKCNMCGKQTEDALALYLHIAKNEHP